MRLEKDRGINQIKLERALNTKTDKHVGILIALLEYV